VFYKNGSIGLSLEDTCIILLFIFSFSLSNLPHLYSLDKCKVRYISWYQSLGDPPGIASNLKHTFE